MLAENVEERLAAAGRAVSRARELLTKPCAQSMDACELALQQAASELVACQADWRQHASHSGLLTKAHHLRTEVLLVGRLLQSAAGFFAGWERILGALTVGYTATGEASPVMRQGKVCCRG